MPHKNQNSLGFVNKEDLYVVTGIHMVLVGQASLIGIMANFLGDSGNPVGFSCLSEIMLASNSGQGGSCCQQDADLLNRVLEAKT